MWREVTPQKHGNSSAFNAKVCFSVIQCTTSACRKTHAKNITIFLHTISYFIRQPNNTEKKANWMEIQDFFSMYCIGHWSLLLMPKASALSYLVS